MCGSVVVVVGWKLKTCCDEEGEETVVEAVLYTSFTARVA